MNTLTNGINLTQVTRLYPGCQVLAITQFYVPGKGFCETLPDGKRCTDNDQYIENVFYSCIDAGATSVQLYVRNPKTGGVSYPDYNINELL